MIVGELKIEKVGVSEIIINGRNVRDAQGKHRLEEDIFFKELTLEQQHMVICEAQQMLARMVDAHMRKQVIADGLMPDRAREIMKQRRKIRSGAGGIAGTDVGPLIPNP